MDTPFKNFFAGTNMTDEKKEEKVLEGKIIKVSDKGWGFIIAKEIPFVRIFFHWTALTQDTKKFTELKRNMIVSFVPVDKGNRGFHAIKVRVVDSTKEASKEETSKEETPSVVLE